MLNEKDMTMVMQILVCLNKEAPWVYEQIKESSISNLAEHYFKHIKPRRIVIFSGYETKKMGRNRNFNFESQVITMLESDPELKAMGIKVTREVQSGI